MKAGVFDLSKLPQVPGQPGKYARFLDGKIEGAGTSAGVYFRFAAPLDPGTLPASGPDSVLDRSSVFLVDVTPGSPTYGTRHPVLVAFHAEEGQFIGKNWLSLRPLPGLPLREATTYAAVITSRVRGATGERVQAPDDLERLLLPQEPREEPYRSAWAKYATLRDYLDGAPLSGQVVQATVFTTGQPTAQMHALRDAVYSTPAPKPVDLAYLRAHDGLAHVYTGRFDSPNFQQGEPPYFDGGGDIKLGPDGKPQVVRTESLRFSLSVPNAELPPSGWPVILYAHGTGGDYLTMVREGLDTRAAFIELPDGKVTRMAMLGIDQVLHGPRDPSRSDPEISFFNMQNLQAARDNVRQGAVDDFQLLRLVENFAVERAPETGRPIRFDPSRIYFMGHSQGGLTGPLFVAAEPKIKAAVLSGAGSVLILSLINKRAPTDIAALVEGLLMEPATEDHPLLNLLQAYFEPADPNNYGPLLFQRPPKGFAPKHVFQTLGMGDNYTPVPNIAAFAVAMGVQPIEPRLYDLAGLPFTGQRWGRAPVQGNAADGKVTAVLRQYTPPPKEDGHFVIFDLWSARRDWTRFLGSHALSGQAVLY
jgi:predicted esterase